MEQVGAKRVCPTCDLSEPDTTFYESREPECRHCKRLRSRRNRAAQARKVAAVERLIDLLALVVNQPSGRPESKHLEEAS